MNILALNTAFAALDGAVIVGETCRVENKVRMSRGQEGALPAFVETLLAEASLGFDDIDRLAVVTGPGSFTGIRVGVSYMRGLAMVLDVPCIGLSSLEAGVPDGKEGSGLAVMQAQRRPPGQTWWAQQILDGIGVGDVQELNLEQLAGLISEGTDRVFCAEGDDVLVIEASERWRLWAPSACLAGRKVAGLEPAAHPPSPVYARAPDAVLPGTSSRR